MKSAITHDFPHNDSAALLKAAALDSAHLMNTYIRPAVVFTHGRGCRLYDSDGNEYLDFLGGIAVNALGHAHPRLVSVIRREAARAIHISNLYHHAYQAPLAAKLCELSGLDRVFFANSGAGAVEAALKLARAFARQHPGASAANEKFRILALENSFHGRTYGALSVTHPAKYRDPFAPLVPGIEFVCFNDVAALRRSFDSTVCAIILEPIQGEGGIHSVSESFWSAARELATAHGAALIADEVQSGLGRTGMPFAFQKFPSLPDMITVAKPLAGGLPLGALIASERFASAFTPGMHGATFGGGPLSCATALEFLRVSSQPRMIANIQRRSRQLRSGIRSLARRFDFIREIRGEGLILGVELSIPGAPVVQAAFAERLLINCTHEKVLRLLPPFIITKRDVEEFLSKFEAVLLAARQPSAPPPSSGGAAVPVASSASGRIEEP
jgi:acetylornithine/N-succinyldiaminopimelate aminotransferase